MTRPSTGLDYCSWQTRVCRKCSVQAQVDGDFCPSCGKSYAGRSGPSKRALAITAALATLLAGGIATAVLVDRHNAQVQADKDARAKVEAQREADERAAEIEAAEVAAQVAEDNVERESRARLVRFLQRNITEDAKKRVSEGLLEGPIMHTSCTATGGGSTDDLTALTGTFQCVAVNEKYDDGSEEGYVYGGTTEWASGKITWRLGG